MKVKQVPQDFVVEERARVRPTDRGPFALYLLRKEGIGTLEALRAVRRAWQVPGRAVGFGGLKDRHAVTSQWVTIPRGPRRNLEQATFRLTYEGQPRSRAAPRSENLLRPQPAHQLHEHLQQVLQVLLVLREEGWPSAV